MKACVVPFSCGFWDFCIATRTLDQNATPSDSYMFYVNNTFLTDKLVINRFLTRACINERLHRTPQITQSSRVPAFSSPTFPSHHKLDIRTLVRFVPFSSFLLSLPLSPITFSSNNADNAVSFPSHDKPFLRRRSSLITRRGSQKKNLKSYRFTEQPNRRKKKLEESL